MYVWVAEPAHGALGLKLINSLFLEEIQMLPRIYEDGETDPYAHVGKFIALELPFLASQMEEWLFDCCNLGHTTAT